MKKRKKMQKWTGNLQLQKTETTNKNKLDTLLRNTHKKKETLICKNLKPKDMGSTKCSIYCDVSFQKFQASLLQIHKEQMPTSVKNEPHRGSRILNSDPDSLQLSPTQRKKLLQVFGVH